MENCKTPLPYFESYANIIFVSCRHVGMADEADSKSVVGNHVWVQVPLPAVKREALFNKKNRVFIMPVSAVCFAAEERSVKIMKNK